MKTLSPTLTLRPPSVVPSKDAWKGQFFGLQPPAVGLFFRLQTPVVIRPLPLAGPPRTGADVTERRTSAAGRVGTRPCQRICKGRDGASPARPLLARPQRTVPTRPVCCMCLFYCCPAGCRPGPSVRRAFRRVGLSGEPALAWLCLGLPAESAFLVGIGSRFDGLMQALQRFPLLGLIPWLSPWPRAEL
jgi:hypothetical protein